MNRHGPIQQMPGSQYHNSPNRGFISNNITDNNTPSTGLIPGGRVLR